MAIEKGLIIDMYKTMVTIRKFEEEVMSLNSKGKLPGWIHLYIGEEAVAVGVCSALAETDYITSTHRGHGHIIAKGADMRRMLAELFGKSTGYNKGIGGSMHIAAPELGILGANGIIGGGIPIATGAALSSWIDNDGKCTVCFFGDGAANQGAFHESINMASAWGLPVVYVCENNLYANATALSRVTNIENIADRAFGYGIPGKVVDGNNVIEVYEATKGLVDRARAGEGPSLLECKTYRWRGHFEGQPEPYRTVEEVEAHKKKCPIKMLQRFALDRKILTEEEIGDIGKEVDSLIKEAVKFAEESPDPDPESAIEHVFADEETYK